MVEVDLQKLKEELMNTLQKEYYFVKVIDNKGNVRRVSIDEVYDKVNEIFSHFNTSTKEVKNANK